MPVLRLEALGRDGSASSAVITMGLASASSARLRRCCDDRARQRLDGDALRQLQLLRLAAAFMPPSSRAGEREDDLRSRPTDGGRSCWCASARWQRVCSVRACGQRERGLGAPNSGPRLAGVLVLEREVALPSDDAVYHRPSVSSRRRALPPGRRLLASAIVGRASGMAVKIPHQSAEPTPCTVGCRRPWMTRRCSSVPPGAARALPPPASVEARLCAGDRSAPCRWNGR